MGIYKTVRSVRAFESFAQPANGVFVIGMDQTGLKFESSGQPGVWTDVNTEEYKKLTEMVCSPKYAYLSLYMSSYYDVITQRRIAYTCAGADFDPPQRGATDRYLKDFIQLYEKWRDTFGFVPLIRKRFVGMGGRWVLYPMRMNSFEYNDQNKFQVRHTMQKCQCRLVMDGRVRAGVTVHVDEAHAPSWDGHIQSRVNTLMPLYIKICAFWKKEDEHEKRNASGTDYVVERSLRDLLAAASHDAARDLQRVFGMYQTPTHVTQVEKPQYQSAQGDDAPVSSVISKKGGFFDHNGVRAHEPGHTVRWRPQRQVQANIHQHMQEFRGLVRQMFGDDNDEGGGRGGSGRGGSRYSSQQWAQQNELKQKRLQRRMNEYSDILTNMLVFAYADDFEEIRQRTFQEMHDMIDDYEHEQNEPISDLKLKMLRNLFEKHYEDRVQIRVHIKCDHHVSIERVRQLATLGEIGPDEYRAQMQSLTGMDMLEVPRVDDDMQRDVQASLLGITVRSGGPQRARRQESHVYHDDRD